jgi:hypothetical protein
MNFDRDTFPHNIGSAGIFEGKIGFDEYLAHVDERLNLVPRYRQRVIRAVWDLSTPAWHDDPNFDIRRHVRLATLRSSRSRWIVSGPCGRSSWSKGWLEHEPRSSSRCTTVSSTASAACSS